MPFETVVDASAEQVGITSAANNRPRPFNSKQNSKYHTDALSRFPSPPQCHHRTTCFTTLRGNDKLSDLGPKLVDGHAELDTQLLAEQVGQRAIVAQV